MMYELILAQKKAQEAAMMAEVPGIKVKPKYEYDSDEETDEVGTWEHRNRTAEMAATKGNLINDCSNLVIFLVSLVDFLGVRIFQLSPLEIKPDARLLHK